MNTTGKSTNLDQTFSTFKTELFVNIKEAFDRGADLIEQGYNMCHSLEEGMTDCIHFYVKVGNDKNYSFIFVFKNDSALAHYNECADKEEFLRTLTQDFVHTLMLMEESGMTDADDIRDTLEYCYENNLGPVLEWVA